MDKALVVSDFDTMQRVSHALFKSGYFSDVKSEAQAIVKVMAGSEIGLPPFAAMSGIHVIKGKPVLGANLIATLVKNDLRYDYRVQTCNNETCTIEWRENNLSVGLSHFTMEEAQMAGLSGKDNWKKYPSDMLFARAISRGARRFAPGIFGGSPVYTPDELGADIDPEGYVVEVEPVVQGIGYEEPDTVAEANAELLGHDGTAEAQASTGKPEPESSSGADAYAWLDEKIKNGRIPLGLVGDSVVVIGKYSSWTHVKSTLTPNEETGNEGFDFPDGFKIVRNQDVTKDGAFKIQAWLLERKEADSEG